MIESSFIVIESHTGRKYFFRFENAAGVRVDCRLADVDEVQRLKDQLNKTLNLVMARMMEDKERKL